MKLKNLIFSGIVIGIVSVSTLFFATKKTIKAEETQNMQISSSGVLTSGLNHSVFEYIGDTAYFPKEGFEISDNNCFEVIDTGSGNVAIVAVTNGPGTATVKSQSEGVQRTQILRFDDHRNINTIFPAHESTYTKIVDAGNQVGTFEIATDKDSFGFEATKEDYTIYIEFIGNAKKIDFVIHEKSGSGHWVATKYKETLTPDSVYGMWSYRNENIKLTPGKLYAITIGVPYDKNDPDNGEGTDYNIHLYR